MIVSACKHENTKKFGKNRNGTPRVRCTLCGKTWTASPPSLLGNMRISVELAERIIKCLCEGTSVRATSRLMNVNPHTVIDLMLLVGGRCGRYMQETMHDIAVTDVQADEAWQFIYCKQRTAKRDDLGPGVGDSYLFTAFERHTKLVLAWHLGKRDQWNTDYFCQKLRRATAGRFNLSTDGYEPYRSAVVRYLGDRVQYGMLVKIFGKSSAEDQRQYSPAKIKAIKKEQVWNLLEERKICTSHCERNNLNLRTFVRRMTRLSNGFSKKWENHEAMLALYICHYNFCRIHGTLKSTPAVAGGLENHRWTVRELIERTATH
jgi:IS1 family transposase/transposase-like protein